MFHDGRSFLTKHIALIRPFHVHSVSPHYRFLFGVEMNTLISKRVKFIRHLLEIYSSPSHVELDSMLSQPLGHPAGPRILRLIAEVLEEFLETFGPGQRPLQLVGESPGRHLPLRLEHGPEDEEATEGPCLGPDLVGDLTVGVIEGEDNRTDPVAHYDVDRVVGPAADETDHGDETADDEDDLDGPEGVRHVVVEEEAACRDGRRVAAKQHVPAEEVVGRVRHLQSHLNRSI